MRITINPVLCMETLRFVSNDGVYEYPWRVARFKGDSTAKDAEARQSAFDNHLMSLMDSQYASQNAIHTYLTNRLQPTINQGGVGISSPALASMRTSATDQIATQYQNAQKAMALGQGRDLPSGVNAQVNGALMASEAGALSGAQNKISLDNEELKQQNYWNSINVLNGVAANENPLGYANAATAGSGAVSSLSQAVTAANGPGLGSILGGIAGGVVGAAGTAGGFGKLFKG